MIKRFFSDYMGLVFEKMCKEYEIQYLGICFTCEAYSKYNIEFSDKIWFQDGKCVNQCNFSAGYGIYSKTNHFCLKCNVRSRINDNEYLCGCPEGTVKSFNDNNCYLQEVMK